MRPAWSWRPEPAGLRAVYGFARNGTLMDSSSTVGGFVTTTIVAGLLGGAAMEGMIGLFSRSSWGKGSMIVALGSLVTKTRENAWLVGAALHAIFAIAFAAIYLQAMMRLGFTHLPTSLMFGLGAGFFQGLVVSLALVWIVSEHHPLEEFREADLAIGLSHLLGHVVYGGVIGLVFGLASGSA